MSECVICEIFPCTERMLLQQPGFKVLAYAKLLYRSLHSSVLHILAYT